jgi:hypothetical protein
MRRKPACHRVLSAAAALACAALTAMALAGCGDFWENPNGATSTGTTASSTTLTPESSSVTAGGTDVLTATVSPTAATGTVTFLNNGASIGTSTLTSGTASYTATFATAGTESLTAEYLGNSTYESSTSSAVTVTVTAASDGAFRNALLPAESARGANVVLDPTRAWTVSANSYPHNVGGVVLSDGPGAKTVQNIEGEGHCVYYSGSIYTSAGAKEDDRIYALAGGGFLAPEGTAGLDCN